MRQVSCILLLEWSTNFQRLWLYHICTLCTITFLFVNRLISFNTHKDGMVAICGPAYFKLIIQQNETDQLNLGIYMLKSDLKQDDW